MALIGLIILIPFFIIIGILIKLDSKGPIFFIQPRVGKKGKLFNIVKFRTMKPNFRNELNLTVGRNERITQIGHYLRKFKIDELPQLINVLEGRMSLVGPRPEVKEFIDEYPIHIREKVLSVKPGITDLASIKMINENEVLSNYKDPRVAYINIILPIKQKYYLEYIDKHNFFYDINIIFLTLKKIIFRGKHTN